MASLIYEIEKTGGVKVHGFCLSVIFPREVCPLLLVLRLDATAAQTEVEWKEKLFQGLNDRPKRCKKQKLIPTEQNPHHNSQVDVIH